MTRRDQIYKWCIYALGLFPIWVLDAFVLSRYPLLGITPTLLPLAVSAVAVLEGGALGPVGGGVIDPLHLYGQPPQAGEAGGGAALFIGGGILEGGVRGVAEGGLGGNGEGVLPLHAGIPGNADQGQEDVVAVFLHGVGVQGDLIGDPVGDQHPAVPVQDVPPGGLHGLGLRNAVLGAGQILRPVDHLGVIEGGAQPEQNDGQQEEHPQPPTVKLFFLHGARPLSERTGHARRVPPTRRKMDRKMR